MKTLLTLFALFTVLITTPSQAEYQTIMKGTINHQGLIVIEWGLFCVEIPQQPLIGNRLVGETVLMKITYEWSERKQCMQILNIKIIKVF